MKQVLKSMNWIKCIGVLSLVSLTALSTGCSTYKDELFPHDDTTMLDIWRQSGTGGLKQDIAESRLMLRRSITATESPQHNYTRLAENEIKSQFQRLPNPDLVMYVYPHLSGTEGAPVPGYSTVFPFYNKVQYAMPGERLEDY